MPHLLDPLVRASSRGVPGLLALALAVPLAGPVAPRALRAQSGSAAVPGAPRPISLGEALTLARRNAPAVVQARSAERASAAALRSARGAFLPSLSVNAATTEQSPANARVNPTTGEIVTGRWATNAGFNLGLDLFDGFRRSYDLRAARAGERAAGAGTEAAGFDVALQVKQQYYAVLAAREAQGAADAQLAQARQQLQISVARVRAQTATRSDSLRARIQLGQAELALLTARNDQQAADAALTRLVGTPFFVTAAGDSLPAERALVLDSAALAVLAEQGPAVRQAVAVSAAARATGRAARAPYFPSLTVSYGRNALGTSAGFDPLPPSLRYSGQLRFGISYPLFNQFTREEAVVRADVAETNADAALRDARLAARESLVRALGTLRTARAQVAIQAATVVAAEEDLRVQQQRYQLGASTVLDVLTSQTQLVQARLGLVQARFAARSARAELETLVGRDL
jgi:outer membrane protein